MTRKTVVLAALLLLPQPVPATSPQEAPPTPPEATPQQRSEPEKLPEELPEELRSRLEAWRALAQSSDPCDLGRTLSRMPPCLEPEDCAAYSLWQQQMPEGPMAALPDPQRRRGMMPAAGPGARERLPEVFYRLGEGEEPTMEELSLKLAGVLRKAGYRSGQVVNVRVLGPEGDLKRLQMRLEDPSDPGALPETPPQPEPEGPAPHIWPGMVPCPAGR